MELSAIRSCSVIIAQCNSTSPHTSLTSLTSPSLTQLSLGNNVPVQPSEDDWNMDLPGWSLTLELDELDKVVGEETGACMQCGEGGALSGLWTTFLILSVSQ